MLTCCSTRLHARSCRLLICPRQSNRVPKRHRQQIAEGRLMNEAAQLFCAAAPHESLNFWPWRDVPRARGGLNPVAFKGWPDEIGTKARQRCWSWFLGERVCQRTTNCAAARPERLQFISALICRECLPRAPNGRCPGLIASCRISCQSLPSTRKRRSSPASSRPTSPVRALGPEMIGLVPDSRSCLHDH